MINVKYNYLEIVFKVIYLGWCDLGQEDISEFLATGKALGVSDLNIKHIDELADMTDIVVFESNSKDIKSDTALILPIIEPEKNGFNTLNSSDADKSPEIEGCEGRNIKVVKKRRELVHSLAKCVAQCICN